MVMGTSPRLKTINSVAEQESNNNDRSAANGPSSSKFTSRKEEDLDENMMNSSCKNTIKMTDRSN